MNAAVLVSTSDLTLAGALRSAFDGAGYPVELVTPGEDIQDRHEAELLVLTGALAREGEVSLARQAHALRLPVFGVVGDPQLDWRAAASDLGLEEVFRAPADADEVLLLGRTAIERRRLQRVTGIVGETDAIREVLERVVQIAPVNSTVLVTGESGTGKELVARGIHALSPRRHRPFIAVNVAALADTLLESELFGHEKGAFTGAVDSRKGLFELAHTGTIFLDEIGEMPLSTQTKLLRVLETREFLRVGGERPIKVDVRVIAATNQQLRRLVAIGEFRRDLYFRLNVLSIRLPPLRQRREDIRPLVEAFIREVSETHDREFVGISHEAMEILESYHWPGNVRELRNLVESMVVLAPGRIIGPADIPVEVRSPDAATSLVPLPAAPLPAVVEKDGGLRPELEFIFRTLVDLRVDMDELKREFEAYRRERRPGMDGVGHRSVGRTDAVVGEVGHVAPARDVGSVERTREVEIIEPTVVSGGPGSPSSPAEPPAPEPGSVVFTPGMTMEDMERQAIEAALQEVGGNRRKAAERLGIGERTLYRKIRKFGLD